MCPADLSTGVIDKRNFASHYFKLMRKSVEGDNRGETRPFFKIIFMKVIFTIDGINYLSPTKKAARDFIDYWWAETITYQEPRRFKTTWRLKHVERAPSYGQLQRVNLDKVSFK